MHLMALCTYDACGETNELKIVLQENETLPHWYKKPAALIFCCLLHPIESYDHFIIYHFFFLEIVLDANRHNQINAALLPVMHDRK